MKIDTSLKNRKKDEPTLGDYSLASLIKVSNSPPSHKSFADNYMVIKNMYGFSALNCAITNQEKAYLARFGFKPLEYTKGAEINTEIQKLKTLSLSEENASRKQGDELLQIRLKELKHLYSNNFSALSTEIYDGYKVLEQYFESISKYN